jgi:hypothetical protein
MFYKLGFTLPTAAVSFRFKLIFQPVLPVFQITPTPVIHMQSYRSSNRFLLY